jgi:hypothetical protein
MAISSAASKIEAMAALLCANHGQEPLPRELSMTVPLASFVVRVAATTVGANSSTFDNLAFTHVIQRAAADLSPPTRLLAGQFSASKLSPPVPFPYLSGVLAPA